MFKKNLIIFHYHLNKGGVTSVIRDSAFLLSKYYNIKLVSSTKASFDFLGEQSINENYGYKKFSNFEEFQLVQKELIKLIKNEITSDDDILVFHNFHLAKNVALTLAIIELSAILKNKIVLYIHDFPEDDRKENYNLLQEFVLKSSDLLYPNLKNVYFIFINNRDYNLFVFLNFKNVCLLNNPVVLNFKDNKNITKENYNSLIKEIVEKENLKFDFSRPTFFYPVRSIRRKNVLEAVFICKIFDFNLITSLKGESSQEKEYSDIISSLNSKENGIFNLCDKYSELFLHAYKYCDFVISTSLKEGSGLAYYESIYNNKKIVYREIVDILPKGFGSYQNLRVKLMDEKKAFYKECIFEGISFDDINFAELTLQDQLEYLNKIELVNKDDVKILKNLFDKTSINFERLKIEKTDYAKNFTDFIEDKKPTIKSVNKSFDNSQINSEIIKFFSKNRRS